MFLGVPITSSDSENRAVIGAAVGGVILLLMITAVLCIVIVYVRRSHEKGKFTLNDKVLYNTTKLNTNVTIEYNASYDVAKVNAMDNGSTITTGNSDFPITPNPSYSTHNETTNNGNGKSNDPGGSDVPITTNPSYNVHTKPYSKASEYDYDYVQPNGLIQHSDLEDTIKMDTNPSYGASTEKQYDYDYVCDDHHLLHCNTATNVNSEMDEDSKQSNPIVDQRKKNHSSNSPSNAIHVTKDEYGVVNQPRS